MGEYHAVRPRACPATSEFQRGLLTVGSARLPHVTCRLGTRICPGAVWNSALRERITTKEGSTMSPAGVVIMIVVVVLWWSSRSPSAAG